jgi:hypothetical protein
MLAADAAAPNLDSLFVGSNFGFVSRDRVHVYPSGSGEEGMSIAVRGYTSIADSQSTALKGYNCNLLRPVHGMLRQAPRPAFYRARLIRPPGVAESVKPLAQKKNSGFPNAESVAARPSSLACRGAHCGRDERAAGCGGREGAG